MASETERGNSESSELQTEVSEIIVLETVMEAKGIDELVLKKSRTRGKNKNQEQVSRNSNI